jgi:hypothetical protein
MFLQGSSILYPIPDYVMQLNALGKKLPEIRESIKGKNLPAGFCYLLEMLNLSYLFPDIFIFEKETLAKMV